MAMMSMNQTQNRRPPNRLKQNLYQQQKPTLQLAPRKNLRPTRGQTRPLIVLLINKLNKV